MWQILCGFGAGVYVGTVYDCKPTLQFVKTCIKNFVPEEAIPKKKKDDDIVDADFEVVDDEKEKS